MTPPVLQSFVASHQFDNKPIVVHARPAGRPVCTVGLPRAARVWAADGPEEDELTALADPSSNSLDVASYEDVSAANREREVEISRRFLVEAVGN